MSVAQINIVLSILLGLMPIPVSFFYHGIHPSIRLHITSTTPSNPHVNMTFLDERCVTFCHDTYSCTAPFLPNVTLTNILFIIDIHFALYCSISIHMNDDSTLLGFRIEKFRHDVPIRNLDWMPNMSSECYPEIWYDSCHLSCDTHGLKRALAKVYLGIGTGNGMNVFVRCWSNTKCLCEHDHATRVWMCTVNKTAALRMNRHFSYSII